MTAARLGENPQPGAAGALGYTIAQAARLIGKSDSHIRKTYEADLIDGLNGARLCRAEVVEAERADVLARLGAVEPTDAVSPSHESASEHDSLVSRVAFLEDRLRLLLAARDSARAKARAELAEEAAYAEMLLRDLGRTG